MKKTYVRFSERDGYVDTEFFTSSVLQRIVTNTESRKVRQKETRRKAKYPRYKDKNRIYEQNSRDLL